MILKCKHCGLEYNNTIYWHCPSSFCVARRQNPRTTVIDLDAEAWAQIKQAASESTWMPPEYISNNWIADLCEFLRNGHPKCTRFHEDDMDDDIPF